MKWAWRTVPERLVRGQLATMRELIKKTRSQQKRDHNVSNIINIVCVLKRFMELLVDGFSSPEHIHQWGSSSWTRVNPEVLCTVALGWAGVLYTNSGYLRSVYAALRRVEDSLRGNHALLAAQPVRRAYAAYATLQNIHDHPTEHIMQFPFI